jgi:lipopolysaccharide transport system ATP-binding protein
MSHKPVISVEQLAKRYRIGEFETYRSLREAIPATARRLLGRRPAARRNHERVASEFWALRDISFDVQEGEVLGIIGHNGAGKSTLLKILSRITEPTEGCARIRGRVSSLLEVGTGFHPELTGRENVYLNGSILGMTRQEIKRKFDEIVEFSGVGKFLDTPVKRYSSGMSVRLAFAVAAHLEPEVLIIDEVLAVGDAEFQSKCLGKMEDVASSGRTVLFVSHNMAAVESLCSTALLLNHGQIVTHGSVSTAINEYLARGSYSANDVDLREHPGRITGSTPILQRLRITDDAGDVLPALRVGGGATFEVHVASAAAIPNLRVLIEIHSPRGEKMFTLANHVQHGVTIDLDGDLTLRARLENCRLFPGQYTIRMLVKSGWKKLDQVGGGLTFHVVAGDDPALGRLPQDNYWSIVPQVQWTLGHGETLGATPAIPPTGAVAPILNGQQSPVEHAGASG